MTGSMTNLGTAFGRMMATMNRDASSPHSKKFLSRRTREPRYFFGFIVSAAIAHLDEKEDMDHDKAVKLLDSFMEARLLHFPDDRMCSRVKNDGAELQPTAKGFAYLEEWFRGYASCLSETQKVTLVSALASPYNSMDLVHLERSLLSETLLLSTGLAMWLWEKMLGDKPNVFDGTFRQEDKQTYRRNVMTIFNVNSVDLTDVPSLPEDTSEPVKSPYWSAAMIHPSSSSTMQYWDSRGMRLFKSLEFERPLKSKFTSAQQYTASLCLSGKAMWQWILECTTAESSSEAAKIVRIFVNQRFVQPISDRLLSWATYKDDLPKHISRLTFYRFTQRGIRLCAWEDSIDVSAVKPSNYDRDEENAIRWMLSGGPSASEYADSSTWAWNFVDSMPAGIDDVFRRVVTLDLINREPGLKLPFRRKLVEWRCEENLRYVEDAQRLLLLLKASRSAAGTVTRFQHLQLQVCDGALEIKRLYIQHGSPFQLNISHNLRDEYLAAVQDGGTIKGSLDHLEKPLENIQTECMLLLKAQVPKFLLEDDLRHLPLSAYVVGCYKECHFGHD